MTPQHLPRQVPDPPQVFMFDISTGRSRASVWHPYAHTITQSMHLVVVLADGTMGEVVRTANACCVTYPCT
jgi:hypothetical protein